jgi:outer membrane protein assembly factor BamD
MFRIFSTLLLLLAITAPALSDDAAVALKLGNKFYRDSLESMALEQYQRYISEVESSEELPDVYFRVAELQSRVDEISRSIDTYSETIRRYPSSPLVRKCYINRGDLFSKKEKFSEAAQDYLFVWRNFSGTTDSKTSLFKAARSLEQSGGSESEAIDKFQLFVTRFPSDKLTSEAIARAVSIAIATQKYSKAKEMIKKSTSTTGSWALELEFFSAQLVEVTVSADSAVALYQKLLTSESNFNSKNIAVSRYGSLLLSQDVVSSKDGELFFNLLRKDSVITVEKLTLLADIMMKSGKYKEAVNSYKKAVDISDGATAEVLYKLAKAYSLSGVPIEAVEVLESVVLLNDSSYSEKAQLKIADTYLKLSLFTTAVDAYRKFYSMSSGDKKDFALFRVGKIYREKLGAPDLALREFDNLLRWYPSSKYYGKVLWESGQIYETLGKLKTAADTYRYLSSLEQGTPLGDDARSRYDYLMEFRIVDSESAVVGLTELALLDSIDKIDKKIAISTLFKKSLKEYYKSVEIIDSLLLLESLADSLKANLLFKSGESWGAIYRKMTFEGSKKSSLYAKKVAIERYDSLISQNDSSEIGRKALFEKIRISDGTISEYEKFVLDYPATTVGFDAAFIVAMHYSKASRQAPQLIAKANEYYEIVLGAGTGSNNYSDALLALILGKIRTGDFESSATLIEKFLSEFPKKLGDEITLYLKGVLAFKSSDYKKSILSFRTLLNAYPVGSRAGEARFYLASSLLKTGSVEDALNNYSIYLTAFPTGKFTSSAVAGKANCLVRVGRVDEAKELLLSEIENGSADGDMLFQYALILEIKGEDYSAVKNYKLALAFPKFSGSYDASISAAKILFSLKEYGQAAKLYNDALKINSDNDKSLSLESHFLSSSILAGDFEKIKERYKEFRKTASQKDSELLNRVFFAEGLSYYRLKEFSKAKKRFSYILKNSSNSSFADNAAYYGALVYYDQGEYEKSLDALSSFINNYESSEFVSSAHFTVASLLYKNDKKAESAAEFEKAATHKSADRELKMRSYISAATVWQEVSGWDEAGRIYSLVYKEFKDRVDTTSFALKTGFVWFKGHHIKKALNYFEIAGADEKSADRAEIAYWTALCYSRLGKSKEALERFLRIPYLYGDSGKFGVTAEFEAARIYEKEGELSNALSLYRKIVRIEGANSPIGGDALERINALETVMEAE